MLVAKGEKIVLSLSYESDMPFSFPCSMYTVLPTVRFFLLALNSTFFITTVRADHNNSSSVVDRVVSKATGKVYARKRINRKIFGHDTQAQKLYENEIRVLSKIAEDDHLIKVRGTYTDKKYLVMLLQPVADRNLKQYMNGGPLTSTTEQKRFRTYFGCLAHTIRFLHDSSMETLHKDIKPENILLKDGRLILTDFGTAFDWSRTGQSMTRSNAGDHRTPRYQSPEVANSSEFHRSSDIWSLGVVFLEMVTLLRGKRIAEMDTFLQSNGARHTEIHLNQDAATNWFEQLQTHGTGSPIDLEPLSWIKLMLNREHPNRPSASAVYQDIAAFRDGIFCGRCCLDIDSSSSGDDDYESDDEVLSDVMEHDDLYYQDPGMETAYKLESQDLSLPMAEPSQEHGIISNQRTQGNNVKSPSIERDNARLPIGSEADTVATPRTENKARHQSKPPNHFTRPSSRRKASQIQDITEGSTPTSVVSSAKKSLIKTGQKPSFDREKFVRWLASLPEKFRGPLTESREARSPNTFKPSRKRHPTVEHQRIGHFLSSLPEEPSEYEITSGPNSGSSLNGQKRSQTFPMFYQQSVELSHSQEELPTPSHLLTEETDDDHPSGVTKSKLVHFASDDALDLAREIPKQSLREATDELKAFAATTTIPKSNSPHNATPKIAEPISPINLEGSGTQPEAVADPGTEHIHYRPIAQASDAASDVSQSTGASGPPSLAAYLKGVPKRRRRRWESATVILERILDDKVSEAPTSIMSANTRSMVSQSRPVLRWNDKYYGYLPHFVANGKVGGVRALLSAGCNPGTAEKPRWEPIYNAIKGATDKHTKCLRELVSYGVNVNAVRKTNGRTPLHYAIEKPLWSGYSSVIYILLAAKADPNARDKSNDVPLLMLLAGGGPLPREKRDALYLLLAPNFATDLDVSIPGTLDNPLHLAIRRKDAYTVDVMLQKMKQVQGRASRLVHKQNSSGSTPLSLAFTIFSLLGEEADEELQIITLLLENGANPNVQDVAHGGTPLHLVVCASKNTLALELLCRHSANANIRNNAGESAIDVAHRLRFEHPQDKWYPFAKRRMGNSLKDEHYRPPELVSFLEEEASVDVKDKTHEKKPDASNQRRLFPTKANPTLRRHTPGLM